MKLLVDKYRPKTAKDIKGHVESVNKLRGFLEGTRKAALIYGKTGIGKTASVYALANELNYEVLEVNASDFRNKDQVNSVIGGAANQASLFGKKKIVLVDELDGIAGVEDKGGALALSALIDTTANKIVMIANDPWNPKLREIRKKVFLIEFQELKWTSVFLGLKEVCDGEKLDYNEDKLKELSLISGGDLRAAINDLQSLIKDKRILDASLLDERDRLQNIFDVLKMIFKSKDPKLVLRTIDAMDINFDEAFLWLEENIPKEYEGEDLVNAFDMLSKADVFRGRIRRWQYYRFLVYEKELMSAGVALAKDTKKDGFVNYKANDRILKLWQAKMKNTEKNEMAKELKEKMHCSTKKIIKEMDYMQFLQ
jgi:replication factor C large subunit